MRLFNRILAASVASMIAASNPAFASTASGTVAVPADEQAQINRVLDIMFDQSAMESMIVDAVSLKIKVDQQNKSETSELFAKHPELGERLRLKTIEIVVPLIRDGLPGLRADASALISSRMSLTQLTSFANFIVTPSGRKLLASGMKAGISEEITGKAEKQDTEDVMRMLRKEDMPLLLRFANSGAADVLNTMAPEMAKISRNWGEQLLAGREEEFELIGMEVALDYFAEKDAQPKTKPTT